MGNESINSIAADNQIIFIGSHRGLKITFIKTEDIIYLKADGVYTEIVTKKNSFVSSNNLGIFEKTLEGSLFTRVHRSYLINTNEIREFYTNEHSVKLSDGSMIPVSGTSLKNFI